MFLDDWLRLESIAMQVLGEHGGLAPLRAFVAAGLTPRQVAAVYRRRPLTRRRNGWYLDPALPWQATTASRVGGVATCVSAAPSYGIPTPHGAQRTTHVSLKTNAARLRHHGDRRRRVAAGEDEAVRTHWEVRVDPVAGWRTSVVDTLLHLGRCVDEDWFIAALDAALRSPAAETAPALGAVDLVRLLAGLPRRLRKAVRLVDPQAESCIETLLRLGLIRRGIGPLRLQFWPDAANRVDILVGSRLILEADGEEFHDPAKDAIRDAHLRTLGYVVLRFSYEEIVFHLDDVLDRVEAALEALQVSSRGADVS